MFFWEKVGGYIFKIFENQYFKKNEKSKNLKFNFEKIEMKINRKLFYTNPKTIINYILKVDSMNLKKVFKG